MGVAVDQGTTGLRWGVLGAGRIAAQFVAEIGTSHPGSVVAVAAGSDVARARAVAGESNDVAAYGSYQQLIDASDVDAVYIATIHPEHLRLIVDAAAAGKHILCEKPITMNAEEARTAAAAASAAGVVLVEAMMFRFQSQSQAIKSVLLQGSIGVPQHVDVACAFRTAVDPSDRLFDPKQGGGAILDVGCYTMSFARMIASWIAGDDGVEPSTFEGRGHIGETGVDDWAVASLGFEGGLTAHLRTGIRLGNDFGAWIYGSEGYLRIDNPWTPGKDGSPAEIVRYHVDSDAPEIVKSPAEPLFGAEVAAVVGSLATGEASPITTRDSVATMSCLDRWRAAVGVA
jgi:predicted dehydrogenase